MRPASKFHVLHEHPKKVVINGPRPSSVRINKDSHLIRKPSSSSTSVVLHKQERDPIIIYTQSPKVIHTKPRDFMALVQRLTGMANSKVEVPHATATIVQHHQPQLEASENFESSLSDGSNSSIKQQEKEQQWKHGTRAGDETCSALKDGETFVKGKPSDEHSHFGMDLSDLSLFNPNSSDFVYSSRSVHKYSDSLHGILGSLLSPSGLEFMKELPEY